MILNIIVDSPGITGKELEEQLNISRKQLGYSVEKMNDYLEDNGFQKIVRLRTGRFVIPSSVIEEYRSQETRTLDENSYIYSDRERVYLLMIMLLCHDEELSTYHFMEELMISKNTLLLDLKKVQETIEDDDINVYYSRKDGYTLLGSEYSKRVLLVIAIRKVLEMPQGEEKIIKICKIDQALLNDIKDEISEIERQLQIQFTDERLKELPYILHIILFRIHKGRLLVELPEAFQHTIGTKEFSAVSSFASKHGITSQSEKMFLTAQVQISNIHSLKSIQNDVEDKLLTAAMAVVTNFEKIGCVLIKEKEQLLEALMQHWRPAYYRITYHYHIETSIIDMVIPQHTYLHELVKKSVTPFEQLIAQPIPDEELVYITVLLGAWLRKEGNLNIVEERRRAVVVCSNGVTVSNFMYITLKELFPEIDFITCLSVRGFQEYRGDFNIVFSTVRLETDKIQFFVKPFLHEASKQKFREKVFQQLEGINLHGIQVARLLEIIEAHATIEERETLIKALDRYLKPSENDTANHHISDVTDLDNEESKLSKLLTPETIQILAEPVDWQTAIRLAAAPLLASKKIEARYIETMIHMIETEQPYIMLAEGVIIAHAGVRDGVNRVAMSLLKLPHRISIDHYMMADIIIVLGTPDTTKHLNALYRLIEILESDEDLGKIRAATSVNQLVEVFQ